jgi:leucyl aminopeptidase
LRCHPTSPYALITSIEVDLEFSTKLLTPESHLSPCVVVGIYEDGTLSRSASALDKASAGQIATLVKSGDIDGATGKTRLLFNLNGIAAERVLVLGMGKRDQIGAKSWKDCIKSATSAVVGSGATSASFMLEDVPVVKRDSIWKARHFAISVTEVLYRFEQMKSTRAKPRKLAKCIYGITGKRDLASAERGLREGRAIGEGMSLARDLGNLPGNICTPSYLAEQSARLARDWKMTVQVLEEKDMRKLGMGALLSVAKGSRQPPKLIVLQHNGGRAKERPVVLVGKGITFDTGGISLKPGAEMDEMKFDMCGAASVIGTMRAVAEMRLPLNVVGIIPAAENMPDGLASKPGDIVTTMSGQTVEILNTDAEGRLVLCDALTYSERFSPETVIDVATLTGACIIALGHVCSGLFSNKDELAREILDAGEESWDRAWNLPLWDDYQEQLKSNFADFANIGGRAAGSVTAACFLSRFTKKVDWAHLDIAGTAWHSGKNKGATGRPIPLLTSFLLKRAGKRR